MYATQLENQLPVFFWGIFKDHPKYKDGVVKVNGSTGKVVSIHGDHEHIVKTYFTFQAPKYYGVLYRTFAGAYEDFTEYDNPHPM